MTRNIITIHAGISIFAKIYAGPSKMVKLIAEQTQNKSNIANLDLIFSKFISGAWDSMVHKKLRVVGCH